MDKQKVLTLLMAATISFSCGYVGFSRNNANNLNYIAMDSIKYTPATFKDILLGYNSRERNKCTPLYPNDLIEPNVILINVPNTIVLGNGNCDDVVVPLCATYLISLRRAYKYADSEVKRIHIKSLDEDVVYSGDILNPDLALEDPLFPPWHQDQERERQKKISEAQSYNDDELNVGQASGGYVNLNAMEYVDMPFLPGKYEIWLSFSGLESNHCLVEIVVAE